MASVTEDDWIGMTARGKERLRRSTYRCRPGGRIKRGGGGGGWEAEMEEQENGVYRRIERRYEDGK